ncbi:hypothetical protein Clacol_007199 [Clathrus columnatus]|uniref:C2H2-type domain-containing protein n=1 Tax=Clathrus columnatus TaxID=1419009 RepID=A0AAV5AGU6_9AGAM|nr:hypothetical protein Clacol_007199 [Clathrus columnatus]
MPTPPSRSSNRDADRLPSLKQIMGDSWNNYDENRDLNLSLVLPPIRCAPPSPSIEPNREGQTAGNTRQSNTPYHRGYWPSKLPPPLGPQITLNVFESDPEEEEERDGKDNEDDDDEPGWRPPTPPPPTSQSVSQQGSLTVPELRPILRLSPRALEEGGPALEAQQHSLLHQYRLPPSLSAENAAPAPPAYVYQTPTVPQPSSGPVPYSFNVLRTQQGDLVNVRTPSVRAQGILRPTAILEDEDESHKRYKCDWPGCEKKYDRPSSLEVHKHSHTRTQPFPCPEPGCPRAFSVKSNMLRHFRSHPKRSGLSAAEVSAASARKAEEARENDNNKEDEDRRKDKDKDKNKDKGRGRERNRSEGREEDGEGEGEKETEKEKEGKGSGEGGDGEVNREKDKDKDKPRTSISTSNPKPPPILTITPAPSTSTTYPATRARTALATAIAAVTSTSEPTGVEITSVVTNAALISPSVSPSPSPLLSPQSPHSTYSSAPTSASSISVGLLSPSIASVSAQTSASSPQSTELLTPYSMHSPNSQFSMQSPRSPTLSASASEMEGEKDRDRLERVVSNREHERGKSISPPIPILVTAPSYTASPTISARSPSPQQQSFFSEGLRSPSPVSPQYRTRALYPVSETRTSIDKSEASAADLPRRFTSSTISSSSRLDTHELSSHRHTLPLPRRTRSPTRGDNVPPQISITSPVSRTISPLRVVSPVPSLDTRSTSPSRSTDRGKGKVADNNATEKGRGSWLSPSPKSDRAFHSIPHGGQGLRLTAIAESNSSPGEAPPSPRATSSSSPSSENSSFQPRLRQRQRTHKEVGFWPTESPVRKRAYHGHINQCHSFLEDEEEEEEERDELWEDEREDAMDVEIAGDKKKRRSFGTPLGILKPGFGKEIEKHKPKDMNAKLNSSGAKEQEKQSYMDVDSSECASLSEPPDPRMSRFSIRAGLGSRLENLE